jgi:hypothetical protein
MENIMDGAARADASAAREDAQSAVQNAKSASSTLKLALLWLAVCIPLLWGVMKALQEPGNLLP